MKVIFLDIDGVLNRQGTKEKCGRFTGVDRGLSEPFVNFVKTSGVNIVLSSTWRRHPEMWDHLHEAGIYWIDKTPVTGTWRGYEIQLWLNDHPDVVSYCILDDLSPTAFMRHQRPFHVQTSEDEGLTSHDLERVRKVLDIS